MNDTDNKTRTAAEIPEDWLEESEREHDTSDSDDHVQHLRMVEAILFASDRPLSIEDIAEFLPFDTDVESHLRNLQESYRNRGITLARIGACYQFRTASDLGFLLRREVAEQRKLSRAAVEILAIIAYHQPVTRADIEEIRGVGLSKGTLDVLLEAGWVRPKGRRRSPGRPMTYGTSDQFLFHFGLTSLDELPGINELKAAGMLDSVEEALERLSVSDEAHSDEGTADDTVGSENVEATAPGETMAVAVDGRAENGDDEVSESS